MRVNAYVVGSGPSTLTVLVWAYPYWSDATPEAIERLRGYYERFFIEGWDGYEITVPAGGIGGREAMVFLGPAIDVSIESWRVYTTWDVQRRGDGTVVAVHPHRDHWRSRADYQTYRSAVEMELPAFTQAVTAAHQARLTEYGGRIGPEENLPMLVNDANQLRQYYNEVGAYSHPEGPPSQPPLVYAPAPATLTVTAGTTSANLTLQTEDDANDEADGTVEAEVLSGTGYTIGTSSPVGVTVLDNDLPPAPTALRINGNLVNNEVTLRWDPVPGATGYNVRYVEEICSLIGVCAPDGGAASPNWQTRTGIVTSGNAVKEATLGGLTEKKFYRVEVQAVVVDPSAWSGFALVYPTNVHPSMAGTRVATIELNSFQANGQFDYRICNPPEPSTSEEEPSPLPMGFTVENIEDIIRGWDEAVKWGDARGNNILRTIGSAITPCDDPEDRDRMRNQVLFYNNAFITKVCGAAAIACWAWPNGDLTTPYPAQSILIRDSSHWGEMTPGGCTRLHRTLRHEVGHAFGLVHGEIRDAIMHPRGGRSQICGATEYDVVATMANYQSR